jgi:hypothetical protein
MPDFTGVDVEAIRGAIKLAAARRNASADEYLARIPKRQPAAISTGRRTANWPQVYVGAAGTGANLHHHICALNMLMYGSKQWWLVPPAHAEFHTLPAAALAVALQQAEALAGGEAVVEVGGPTPQEEPRERPLPRTLRCTQRAGDLLYVPDGWGHAVLNLDTAVGYAREFASPLTFMSH